MKLWLKDFEHNISPVTWEAADRLCQDGRVRNLREIETHFWVARVEVEDGFYETEVIITPQKIKAYACECFSPGRRLMCAHIAATLLKIRQFLEQRAEERKAKAEAARSNELSRLTIQSVLDHATPETLEAFVRDYARRDRDFALALKTWFAGAVTEAENPYLLVLDSVLPKTTPAKGYRDPEFRRVRKALDGLEVQLNHAIEEGNFRVIYLVSAAMLTRILPLLEKTEGNRREALLHFCSLALQKIADLPEKGLSLELRDASWQLIFDFGMNGMMPNEMQRDAIRFLSRSSHGEQRAAGIAARFQETPFPSPTFLLQLFLVSLAARNMPQAIPRVLDDFSETPELIKSCILQLYYLQRWDATITTAEHFLAKGIFSNRQRIEIEELLLFIAEKTGDQSRLIRYLRQKFMQGGNLDAYRRLRDAAGNAWPEVREQLAKDLALRGDSHLLAAALAAGGQVEELMHLIDNEENINLLQRYEHLFFPENRDFVRKRYLSLLSRYLGDHFGAPSAVYVRQRLAELWAKGQQELAIQIIRELIPLFPDRTSLPEELAELVPKTRRKAFLNS